MSWPGRTLGELPLDAVSSRLRLPGVGDLSIRDNPTLTISLGVPLAAGLVGVALAVDVRVGLALALALIYLTLALISLEVAIVLWLPLAFLEAMPAFNLAVKAGGLVLVGLWIAIIRQRRQSIGEVLGRNPVTWCALGGLLLWITLSLLWAADRGEVLADLWRWYADALLMVIIATTFVTGRAIRWLVAAFVAGAVASVVQGIASGGLSTSSSAIFTESEGRLAGGLGDPNFLAAAIVPAMVLSLALIPSARSIWTKWVLVSVLPLLALGLAASESRGGILAAIAAIIAAFVVFKRQRAFVVFFAIAAITVVGTWFALSPTAWSRITETESGGSGRSDLWTVAWRVVEDEPVAGVGLNNWAVVSSDYLQQPGSIDRADLIVDRRQEVHNAYLQLTAEAGFIGLGLLLVIMLGSLSAAWAAARRFEADGQRSMDILARGYIVAMTGMMAASFFISSGVDKRLWALLALGPALAAAAHASRRLNEPGPLRLISPMGEPAHEANRPRDLQPEAT